MRTPSSILAHAIDLEALLSSHGADVFGYERLGDRAVVPFEFESVKLRLMVTMPDIENIPTLTEYGRKRTQSAIQTDYLNEVKKRWAALRWLIKAKLDGIEVGVTTFAQEFDHLRAPVAAITSEAGPSR